MDVSYIFGAFIPAVLLTVLFYVDQNLSTLMAVRGHGEIKSKVRKEGGEDRLRDILLK